MPKNTGQFDQGHGDRAAATAADRGPSCAPRLLDLLSVSPLRVGWGADRLSLTSASPLVEPGTAAWRCLDHAAPGFSLERSWVAYPSVGTIGGCSPQRARMSKLAWPCTMTRLAGCSGGSRKTPPPRLLPSCGRWLLGWPPTANGSSKTSFSRTTSTRGSTRVANRGTGSRKSTEPAVGVGLADRCRGHRRPRRANPRSTLDAWGSARVSTSPAATSIAPGQPVRPIDDQGRHDRRTRPRAAPGLSDYPRPKSPPPSPQRGQDTSTRPAMRAPTARAVAGRPSTPPAVTAVSRDHGPAAPTALKRGKHGKRDEGNKRGRPGHASPTDSTAAGVDTASQTRKMTCAGGIR